MARYKTCERCGCNLDFGEVCDCSAEKSDREPLELAREDIVTITLEKWYGAETFKVNVDASSKEAALNGLKLLVYEYASISGDPPLNVVAMLASLIAAPALSQNAERAV